MAGILTFSSLPAAIHAGFQVEQPFERGYVVRCQTLRGWLRALVVLKG